MADLGKELYETYLITMARFGINIERGWKDLSDNEKHAWHDTAMDFARLL